MQIKTFAQKTNLSPKTIRYYEGIGLLPPPARKANGYRTYNEEDVTRARFVAGARKLDISLSDIRKILELREQQSILCQTVLNLLEDKIHEINQHIANLKRKKAELRALQDLGETLPTDDTEWRNCICHLVSQQSELVNS